MKRSTILNYILTITLIAGVSTSCKDYLDVNPVSSFGPDYVFSNVTNVNKALLGVYSALGGDQGYGIRVSMYYPYDNDEMMGQGSTPYPDNERRDIAHYSVQPSNTQLASPFNQMYTGIERANLCIYYIPKMSQYEGGTASEKKDLRRLYAEALTLRAQFYLELLRNWGDLPSQFQPSSFETDLFKSKTDRDEIYDHVLADLGEAADLLPWLGEAGATDNTRITQGAARALRARIAFFRGGYALRKNKQMERAANYLDFYQIAKDECNTIIQKGVHKLNPSFKAVFKDALDAHKQEPNGEIIWEVGMTGGNSANGDSKLGYYNGPRWNGKGNGALTILPTFFYLFDENDTRRDVTCAPYDINSDGTIVARSLSNIVDGKFRRDWIVGPDALKSEAQYFGVNWPLVRYSDVLLMFAEADNEINHGPSSDAIAAFEQVRVRGFGGNSSLIGTTPTDYDGFFSAIMKERSLELGGEGMRKYDLIRWNRLASRLQETKDALTAMADGVPPYDNFPTKMYYKTGATSLQWTNSFYEIQPGSPPAGSTSVDWRGDGIKTTILTYYAISFEANKSELFPIHTSIIDTNPNLTQDYGF